MSAQNLITGSLSRRRFLTATSTLAAIGAASAILPAGVTRAFAAEGKKEILSGSHWGAFWGAVEDGRFTGVRPWEKDPNPNPALPGVQDMVYNAARIKYPMVRRSYLENGPKAERDSRGSGDFVRVSWDQALDLVAKEIQRLQDEEGPWSIYTGTYGWRSSGRVQNPQNMLKKLMNLKGGAVFSTGDYSKGALAGIMPYILGQIDAEGPQTSHRSVMENSDLIVFWASDPLKDNRISAGVPDHGEKRWFDDMKAKTELKKIFINPVNIELCKEVQGEWLPARPHADIPLALGICHTLLTEDLYDKEFIENYTFGFDKFADYLMGTGWDKIEKTAEWAAGQCEVPAEKIRELARLFVSGRTMLVSGWTPQRQQYGEQWPWMFITMASMIGQIGLPGGGFCQRYHLDNAGAPHSNGPALGSAISPGMRKEIKAWPEEKGHVSIPCARIVDMLENPGGEFEHNGGKHVYPDVKMTYWVGGNPFHHHQDRNRMRNAWKKFETVVIQDYQWTASARFADIVLPATTACERNDIERIGNVANLAFIRMAKIIDPVFEARDDWDIFVELAKRLGVESEYTEGKTPEDLIADIYNQAKEAAAKKDVAMPDFEEFWEKGIVEFEIPEANELRVKYADFREDPLMNMMPTATGKIEIFSNEIEKFGYDDCPPHASWIEPVEWLGQKDKTYPLHLNSSHPDYRLHSQLCASSARELYAVNGHEPCWINTKDAADRGIVDGDIVRVFNGRGQILAGAKVTDDIRPNVIKVQEGAWYDPEDITDPNTLCKYGDPNVLTIDIGTSRLAQATSAHTCMVEVEKFTGTVPEITVFTAPQAAE
ncbi:trimethylamine-N-oxide reductase TorA [Hoeflea olei]|uniref:trimethylamine-N-oxide reductase n=1 Tax=Hoeflea olei TaxID=1480615 RepID=A0A1C1YS61_9HYPH|nr:trimethylamine-N-oxide reductase TorA [Hoeflea olei]OCW56365.1 trimethylamine N-oxide reductase I catalytic subunit [Hoeflea olei]